MTSTQSLTEQNRAIVEKMYAAGTSGDVAGLMSYLDENVEIYEPEYLPYGGVYRGMPDFLELLGKIGEYMDVTRLTVHYLVADGDRVIAVLGAPDVKTGQFNHFAEQSTLRDGKVVEMRLFYYDPQAMIST
ncbi:MAG TPA: nuclear transport factor 2 family protein [Pseudonocardia sp.]|jgi:hypothetical protein